MEAQRTAVAAYIASQAGELVTELVEVESGKLRNRPILEDALTRCRRTGSTLVIAKLDRLARNVAFVATLMDAKVEFVAVDFPAANRLMLHILAAFAEHERDQIAARTKAALAAAKARGVRLGANGENLGRAHKAAALAFAEGLRPMLAPLQSKGLTLVAIAKTLDAQGLRTREGARWTPTAVRRVLLRLGLPSCRIASAEPSIGPPVPINPGNLLAPTHASLGVLCSTQ